MSWDDFENEVKAKSGNPLHGCKLCKLIAEMEPKDRKAIEVVLGNENFSSRAIKRGLDVRGVQMSPDNISKHRRGDCR